MSDQLADAADRALEAALVASGARDPREFYRGRLRDLKQASPVEYEAAVTYYHETLIPDVAGGEVDPLEAWTEYGRRLAVATTPGRTVSVDESGLAHEYDGPEPHRLVVHLPRDASGRALLVALPSTLSPAQRATYRVLVEGKQRVAS